MPRENNFLLGRGEVLTHGVNVARGGSDKNAPYDFSTARQRVAKDLNAASTDFATLPLAARPKGEVVAAVTMHPRFLSKTDHPEALFEAVGLRTVGSRSQQVTPESWGTKRKVNQPDLALTETYFVAGTLDSFLRWGSRVEDWDPRTPGAQYISHIERIAAFMPKDKLRGIPLDLDHAVFEIVLHDGFDSGIVEAFYRFSRELECEVLREKRRDVRGLSFIPLRAATAKIDQIAMFSFVRVARGMPSLRPARPTVLRAVTGWPVTLPPPGVIAPQLRAVVFDGGLPDGHPLAPWVTYIEPLGIGAPALGGLEHGLGVTSALLFGPLQKGQLPPVPVCPVDHVRVLDDRIDGSDTDVIDVLDRIEAYLDAHPGKYEYINVSLGPSLSVEDDDVTLWTAKLDQRFAHGTVVAAVAAGNNGRADPSSGMNRVQVPADGVNVLSVGAADRTDSAWRRADYSAMGPGRAPGRVKPDILAFGGSELERFMMLGGTSGLEAIDDEGTSFASPLALRTALSIRAMLGSEVSPLAVRALLVHQADRANHPMDEVGWGRSDLDPMRLITCEDTEVTVVYQGTLLVGEHLRAPVPLPPSGVSGKVTLTTTLLIAPEVDPQYPGMYTRSGIEVAFRPNDTKFGNYMHKGVKRISRQPKTRPYFSGAKLFGRAEFQARQDGHKWEPCLKHAEVFDGSSLSNPVFDIWYHHRLAGARPASQQPIPYALVVGLRAPSLPNFYDLVVRHYASILTQLRPTTRIQVSV